MTSSLWAKTVRVIAELDIKVAVQDEPDDLLEQFVAPGGQSEGAFLRRVFLLDVDTPHGGPSIAFSSQRCDVGIDFRHTHAINGFFRCAFGCRPIVAVKFSVVDEVQLTVKELSIDAL